MGGIWPFTERTCHRELGDAGLILKRSRQSLLANHGNPDTMVFGSGSQSFTVEAVTRTTPVVHSSAIPLWGLPNRSTMDVRKTIEAELSEFQEAYRRLHAFKLRLAAFRLPAEQLMILDESADLQIALFDQLAAERRHFLDGVNRLETSLAV